MMQALTARQTQILKALIDEYIETAEPVGSESLEKKYSLGVSPATIRNEMADLTKKGYLRQPHTSAGRVPTPEAMHFYIDQLMEERTMSLADEVKAKEEVWDAREDMGQLMRDATQALAQRTNTLAISALDNKFWYSGYANVFRNPEFMDLELSTSLFSLLDEVSRMQELLFERITGVNPVEVIFGEELGWEGLNYIGIAGTKFNLHDSQCALAVVGPTRLEYPKVFPILKYFRKLVQDVAR